MNSDETDHGLFAGLVFATLVAHLPADYIEIQQDAEGNYQNYVLAGNSRNKYRITVEVEDE